MQPKTYYVGRYPVQAVLGRGSFGTVYLGTHPDTGRPIAVKVLDRLATGDPALHEALRRDLHAEAAALVRIRDRHCVRVHDVVDQRGIAALVTEYVDGASLRAVLQQHGRLAPTDALGVLRGAITGLVAVHGAGIVHGDLKPDNVLLDRRGVSHLIDFGLAAPPMAHPVPGSSWSAGTPGYLAPETIATGVTDVRSDLYACAVMIFELLCGRRPFVGEAGHVLQQHVHAPVPDPRTLVPDLGDELAQVVMAGLAKDPGDRSASAAELLQWFEWAASARWGAGWAAGVLGLSGLGGVVGGVLAAAAAPVPLAGAAAAAGAAGAAGGSAAAAAGGVGVAAGGGSAAGGAAGGGATAGAVGTKAVIVASTVAVVAAGTTATVVAAHRGDGPERPQQTASAASGLAGVSLTDFTYAGACGTEARWGPTEMRAGEARTDTGLARVTDTQRLTAYGRELALVTLSCQVPGGVADAVHLVGLVHDAPTDLGIVALGDDASVRLVDGRLEGAETYASVDRLGDPAREASFAIELAGDTPVRVFDDTTPDGSPPPALPGWVADLPAHGWDAGVVAVTAEAGGAPLPGGVGVVVEEGHVLASGRYDAGGACDDVTVAGPDGVVDVDGLADAGSATASALRLAGDAPAEVTRTGRCSSTHRCCSSGPRAGCRPSR